jgi:polar amino acid transport system permease protein
MNFTVVTMTLLKGFGTTCLIFAATIAAALPLGLVISFGSRSRITPIKWLTRTFVWFIRGTPLMLQVLIVFFGPGLIWSQSEFATNFTRTREIPVIIAFIVNYAAYFSEIFRGGIEGVPRGQQEAGLVLGMTRRQIFFKVTLLQLVKRIVPPMSNEIITLVKDTAIARVVASREILMEAFTYLSKGLLWPLFYSGVFYLMFNGLLTLLFGWIERRLDYFKV